MILKYKIQIVLQMVHGITHLFARNYIENYLRYLLEMQELIRIISCVILMHMKDKINHLAVMMEAAVGVVRYQQIKQQKHYNCSFQPYILLVVG